MVNEYLRQNCEYSLGSLKPQIFLLPKEGTAINYSIDNNTCEVRGINADTIYKMMIASQVTHENVAATKEEIYELIDYVTDKVRGEE